MLKRFLTALVLALVGIPAIIYGGVFFWLFMGSFITIAAWEYINLMRAAETQPSMPIAVGGVFILLLVRTQYEIYQNAALALLVFLAMTHHIIAFEKGRDKAAEDFSITITPLLYMGWLGAYLIKLREIPETGLWWFFLVLPTIWFTDTGAYFIGKNLGKHKLAPRLSPKKTWEGYWGGVFFGTLGSMLFAWLWREQLGINLLQGAMLGITLAMLTVLGDLGESMIKRQSGIKDSSNILPGHGGIFDRIDSWIWAAPLGYYIITWFFLK